MAPAPRNLVNLKSVDKGYGSRSVLRDVTLGVDAGDRIGIVGRNGDGKSTLLRLIAGRRGARRRRGHARAAASGSRCSARATSSTPRTTIRDELVGGRADHEWAADATLPRGARRAARRRRADPLPRRARHADRAALGRRAAPHRARAAAARRPRAAAARRADEPPRRRGRRLAGAPPRRAPRLDASSSPTIAGSSTRSAPRPGRSPTAPSTSTRAATRPTCWRAPSATARRRRATTAASQLLRKELAWLRRGPPARTSKPKFRIEAANALIADEPEAARPRRAAALRHGAAGRQGARRRRRLASPSATRRCCAT